MTNKMEFPETWEEFEKQHGFNGFISEMFPSGIRLIPSFRVEQWLEHLKEKTDG